ncbi:MAG TPA: cytochrome c peroxidase [Polyangiaceae bacterium]|jgi:cytochrome c peroxidase|nr:cytochrome c peroxidase [Polyangiaceae bacterium]
MSPRRSYFPARAAAFFVALLWAACATRASAAESLNARRAALGRQIFFDANLSEPRGTSCASCHDPALGFAGDHGSGAGVAAGSRPGVFARRNTPSLLYLKFVPKFRFYREDDEKHALESEAYGGFFWDGRADSIAALVSQPLLNPREMNNGSLARIAEKLGRASYAPAFRREFPRALGDPEAAVAALGALLEAFLTAPDMAPFSSKYDGYIRGTAKFNAQEAEGLRLFKDLGRVGCAKCHTLDDRSPVPERSMFTDYGYEAVAAPRNRKLAARDEDRGLCERTDASNPTSSDEWCISFRTPSLRNVALRRSFMHNGAFTSLRDVVSFYATRASNPDRWYPSGTPFDDTPAPYRGLVNLSVVPYNRKASDGPALNDAEIASVVAFLATLTDKLR